MDVAGLPAASLSTSPKLRPQPHFFLQQRPCWPREELSPGAGRAGAMPVSDCIMFAGRPPS